MSEVTILDDRRVAMQNLIDLIMVSRTDQPDVYRRIVRHEPYLRGWFMSHLSWRLLSGPGVYRLERLPSHGLPGRGLPQLGTPMDYACLCWSLWFAETRFAATRHWFVISELAGEIGRAAEGRFRLEERADREALVRALELLDQLGILTHRDGDAGLWASSPESGDETPEVLYEFTDCAPRLIANFDIAGLDRLDNLEPGRLTLPATGEHAPSLVRAMRCLVLGPVLWQRDDPEAFKALSGDVERIQDELMRSLGWELELGDGFARIWRTTTAWRAGSVLIDLVPDPDDTGKRRMKYINHPILLLLGSVRSEIGAGRLTVDEHGAVDITGGRLRDLLLRLYRDHRRNWGVELGEQTGFEQLHTVVMDRMRQTGLLRGPDGLDRACLLPTAALATGEYERTEPRPTAKRTKPAAEQLSILG